MKCRALWSEPEQAETQKQSNICAQNVGNRIMRIELERKYLTEGSTTARENLQLTRKCVARSGLPQLCEYAIFGFC